MKKYSLLLIISLLFLAGFVSAEEFKFNYSSSSIVQIKQLKYEPYPVNPNEYFDLWVSVQIVGNNPSEDIVFELQPEYPFSLDSNEDPMRSYGKLSSPSIVLKYGIRVDRDAIEGENKLKLAYKIAGNWYTQTFDINVQNSQTNFDAVIQEVTESEVSIAIANTGKHTANSVIIRIPEQESFRVTGTDGQMVGNLESGDYTIVSFSVSPTITRPGTQNISRREASQNYSAFSNKLKFDIYYTDNIGERRIVNMELPLNMNAGNFSSAQGIMGFGRRTVQTSSWSSWYTFIIVIATLIIVFGLYKKYPRQIKNFFNKTNVKLKKISKKAEFSTSNLDTTPNWIKNVKDKEKKK